MSGYTNEVRSEPQLPSNFDAEIQSHQTQPLLISNALKQQSGRRQIHARTRLRKVMFTRSDTIRYGNHIATLIRIF